MNRWIIVDHKWHHIVIYNDKVYVDGEDATWSENGNIKHAAWNHKDN